MQLGFEPTKLQSLRHLECTSSRVPNHTWSTRSCFDHMFVVVKQSNEGTSRDTKYWVLGPGEAIRFTTVQHLTSLNVC